MKTTLLSTMFIGHQVEQNAEEEVQQYNEVDDMLYILYFNDHALFSLNAAGDFSNGIIHAVSRDSYSAYFICLYSYKLFPSVQFWTYCN